MSNIGIRIKELRQERGLSHDELAAEIKFAKSIIWGYEMNKKEPGPNHLKRIADYFNVSLEYLQGRDSKQAVLNLQNKRDVGQFKLLVDNVEVKEDELLEAVTYIKARRMLQEDKRKA